MKHSDKRIALRISLIYVLVAGLWVLLSDHLLASLISNPSQWLVAGIGKGWLFVLITAGLLYFLLLRELQQRRPVEQALRESQSRFSRLADHLPDVLYRYRLRPTPGFEYVSPAATTLTGYTPAEYYADPELGARLVQPDDRPRLAVHGPVSATGDRPAVVRLIRKDGSLRWTEQRRVPVYDEAGSLLAIEGIIHDMTNRVMAYNMLEQRVEERTRELATLLELSRRVAFTLELDPLLDLVLDSVKALIDSTSMSILSVDNGLKSLAYRGPASEDHALPFHVEMSTAWIKQASPNLQEPLILADVQDQTARRRILGESGAHELRSACRHIRSWMGVPLLNQERLIGVLSLAHRQPNHYSVHQAELAFALANPIAAAIKNARLYEQAQHAAAIEERQRLARELHDAVTQTLFSAGLIAEVLPRLWQRNQPEARRRLEELRQLTRGALAEMRTLLLELRPSTLTEARLDELLRHLTEAITGRTRTPVALEVEGDCLLPPAVQVVFYRITQEALNNIAKHARANQAVVRLGCRPNQVELAIEDDGCGFELENLSPEHLGLGIMRERADSIGAALTIQTQPGQGTHINLVWSSEVAREVL
jgi:two-component system nitrate/nitrite sensor histidine kinase NarX